MKLDTAAIVTKGLCFTAIGFFTPLTAGLAQWANSGEWPGNIVWIVMGASCCVGAATQMLAFLSQSFGDYKAKIKLDSDTEALLNVPVQPVKPTP
jgi:hypothetical protein